MLRGARDGAWAKSGEQLPYDAEVEWIERDGLIPLTVQKALNFDKYWSKANVLRKDLITDIEVECMGYENGYAGNSGTFAPIFVPAGGPGLPILSLGVACVMAKLTYINPAGFAAVNVSEKYLDGFRRYRVKKDQGLVRLFIDDVLSNEESVTSSVVCGDTKYGILDLASNMPQIRVSIRVKHIKMDDVIDMIPVVKDNMVGFYNRVDGELILTSQPCYKAGPIVL